MKKILSVMVAMMLCLTAVAACAEGLSFDPVEVQFNDIGLKMYRPADMELVEITDADVENGTVWAATLGDELYAQIDVYDAEGVDLETFSQEMYGDSDYSTKVSQINGIDVIAIAENNEDPVVGVLLFGSDGYIYQFSFYYTTDEAYNLASEMMSTLQAQ